jgi:rhodanese-related sulfurtransferase
MPAIRISPADLKEQMEHEKFIILDLRQNDSYDESQEQIKGSVRLDPNDDAAIQRVIDSTDKNAAIVGYCT